MRTFLKNATVVFAAGMVGGLANRLAIWLFAALGITQSMQVKFTPPVNVNVLYPGLIWGGIWGLIFLIPILKDRWFWRGMLYSLAPSAVMLFYILPYRMGKSLLGTDLGQLMWVLVLVFNAVWGLAASGWLKLTETEPGMI